MNRHLSHWIWIGVGLTLIGWGAIWTPKDIHGLDFGGASGQLEFAPVPTPAGLPTQTPWLLTTQPHETISGSSLPDVPTEPADPVGDAFFGIPEASALPTIPNAAPTAQPRRIPDRIVIPKIKLDAPVVQAQSTLVAVGGMQLPQWLAPDELAAGWHTTSAPLGEVGNTVLNGHHNEFGEVFGNLVDLKIGDEITVFSGKFSRSYRVTNRMILPERNQPVSVRLENARWLSPTTDERLTLVTCWPHTSNTHRLIVVAAPEASVHN